MSADRLLSHLEGVKRTGPDRWLARCPSHQDRTASLSIRETDDDRVLAHCFAGCSVHEIVAAAGLELSDLFPDRPQGHHGKPERRPFNATDVLQAIGYEALEVAAAGASLLSGQPFGPADRERLMLAVERIQAAVSAVNPTFRQPRGAGHE